MPGTRTDDIETLAARYFIPLEGDTVTKIWRAMVIRFGVIQTNNALDKMRETLKIIGA